ncbi:hypothetical protein GCM10008955_39600 [Deinococcus malanensis]|uniref:Uncharacterized protein n=1 Tax=Deinococcus malanensis TaxID=1706855 RepID=A0ABQ2F1R7_9DEIO|nr:hypothetical protein GCM10008955_39600 [Deinococcus malanensis]
MYRLDKPSCLFVWVFYGKPSLLTPGRMERQAENMSIEKLRLQVDGQDGSQARMELYSLGNSAGGVAGSSNQMHNVLFNEVLHDSVHGDFGQASEGCQLGTSQLVVIEQRSENLTAVQAPEALGLTHHGPQLRNFIYYCPSVLLCMSISKRINFLPSCWQAERTPASTI